MRGGGQMGLKAERGLKYATTHYSEETLATANGEKKVVILNIRYSE